jgi:acyl-CoA thioesterase FadM
VELAMRYKRPVSLPEAITVRTWVEESSEWSELWLRGHIEDGDESVFGDCGG